MKKIFKGFIIKILVLTLTTILISSGIFYFFSSGIYFRLFPIILLMFPIVSIFVHYQLLKASQKSPARFNVAFMSSFMIKFFTYGGITALIIYFEPDTKKTVVFSVLSLYAVYLIFETKQILTDIKTLNADKK
jgi:hypothetical protein